MANENFLQLPTVTSSQLTDVFAMVQANVTCQVTLQQMTTAISNGIVLFYSGNPNGNLAGTSYNFCWDGTDKILYICTVTGNASTAVWTNAIASSLIAGNNISIVTTSTGTTISASDTSGIVWNNVVTSSVTMAQNNGYVINNGSQVTLTLPATSTFGSSIFVAGFASGGWKIAQNAGQKINVGSGGTTVGTGGSLASTNQFDSITLLCVVANTNWVALSGPQGNLTLV